MKKLSNYFQKEHKLPLFGTAEELEVGVTAIEIRNLFVHNRGILNRVFKERATSLSCTIGEPLGLLDGDLVLKHAGTLLQSVNRLQVEIMDKFNYSDLVKVGLIDPPNARGEVPKNA